MLLARGTQGRGSLPFLLVLVLALALRLANAAWGSLKLDDFHTLYHARASDLSAFFDGLTADNHPPISFLLVRVTRAALGESEWALRVPSLLAGLGTFVLLWLLGARLPCARGRAAAALLLATSTLHVEISSDVRMYALLALASAGLLEGLLACLEEARGTWRVALWTVVGLHTHYHFLYTLVALGSTSLLLGLTQPRYRSALRPCLAAFALGGLASAPWYLTGFLAQLRHDLAPGGSNASVAALLVGFKNLVFLNVSVAGTVLRWVGLGASALMLLLALLGGANLLRAGRAKARPALSWLCIASAFLVPALAWVAARISPRAGFDWRYLAGALPALCLVLGAEACATGRLAGARRAGVLVVGLCALAVALPNARDPGGEDYRGAIGWITAHASSTDALVAADWQPVIFPHALAWDYYAPRLARGRPLPRRLEYANDLSLVAPQQLDGFTRVICCLRSLKPRCGILQVLRQHFAHEEVTAFGRSVYVHVFTRS